MKKILLGIIFILASAPAFAQSNGAGIGYWKANAGVTYPLLAPTTPTDCSAPQYSFTGDTNTGIGYTAADSFSLCTGGAARLTAANGSVTLASGDSFNALGGTITTNRDSIGVTSTDGLILSNATAAAAGAQQMSPRIRLTGQGWKTDATAASQTVDWVIENLPVQGAAIPVPDLKLSTQINGGGYVERARFTTGGLIVDSSITSTTGALQAAGNIINTSGTGDIYWASRTIMTAPADAQWRLTNNAATSGFQFTITGDGKPTFATRSGGTAATQLGSSQATDPTCTANCGTSPTVVGSDSHFRVTMGATGSPASGWVITFNGTWDVAPVCHVTMGLAGMAVGKLAIVAATTTTTMTVTTNGTAPANSDIYNVTCGAPR